MKSEHRHDLKTNDLAKSLFTFQDYAREYGGRVILGLVIVILAIVLIVQRMGNSGATQLKVRDDLAYARNQIDRLNHVRVSDDGRPTVRPAEVDGVRKILQEIRDKASDKNVLAAAAVAMGDYSWALANYPDLPAAATQPSLKPDKDRADLLKDAQSAYQQVLSEYPDEVLANITARFGLGAVAENQSNWDEAKKQYEAVKAMASPIADTYKILADARLKELEAIRQPVLVGAVPEKAELPKPPTPSTTITTTPATTQTTPAPTTKASATTRPSATTKPTK
jgi:tetratricopeptide (TPR) repeat protein